VIEKHASGLAEKEPKRSRGCYPPSFRGRHGPSLGKSKKSKKVGKEKSASECGHARANELRLENLRCWPVCRADPARAVVCVPVFPLLSVPAPAASGRAARGGSQASAIPRGRLGFY